MAIRTYADAVEYMDRHAAGAGVAELREFVRLTVEAFTLAADVNDEAGRADDCGHAQRLSDLEADAERLCKALPEAEAALALIVSDGREALLHEAVGAVWAKAADPRGRAA